MRRNVFSLGARIEIFQEEKPMRGFVYKINKKTLNIINEKGKTLRVSFRDARLCPFPKIKDRKHIFQKGDQVYFMANGFPYKGQVSRINKYSISVITPHSPYPCYFNPLYLFKKNELIKIQDIAQIQNKIRDQLILGTKNKKIQKWLSEHVQFPSFSSTFSRHIKPLIQALYNSFALKSKREIEIHAQALIAFLNHHYQLPETKTICRNKCPIINQMQYFGFYKNLDAFTSSQRATIICYPFKRKGVLLSFDRFLNSICHEWMHHFDFFQLHIIDQTHDQGFQKRIDSLKKQMTHLIVSEQQK